MKENPDLWEQICIVLYSMKEQGISALLAGGMAILRSLYNAGERRRMEKNFFRWTDVCNVCLVYQRYSPFI